MGPLISSVCKTILYGYHVRLSKVLLLLINDVLVVSSASRGQLAPGHLSLDTSKLRNKEAPQRDAGCIPLQ